MGEMADTELEIEAIAAAEESNPRGSRKKRSVGYWVLLLLNCLALSVGSTAGPLLLRLYFLHGGSRRWLSSWLETAGWPILILPLMVSHSRQSERGDHVSPKLFVLCCGIGVLTGLDDYMYAWGVSYLPVSTSSLLIASQLGFNAVFAFLLVRQKFSSYSINSVVLLTFGSVLLAFHSGSDRPKGVTNRQYILGFVLTLGAAALYGLILPMIELMYRKSNRTITYSLVMEMQLIMSFSATALCTVGMLVNKDFQAIHREAKEYGLGEANYYMALVWGAISWQLFFIGVFGVIFLTTSLLSGIVIAVLIPVTEILGVILFHEKFSGEKAMAMLLALWGFASYLYGEYKYSKKSSNIEHQNPLHETDKQPAVKGENKLVELIGDGDQGHNP
eukprot:Gb_04001 [translate_table: standard]